MQKIMRHYYAIIIAFIFILANSPVNSADQNAVNGVVLDPHKSNNQTSDFVTLRQQIAQKLFIDLRFYCEPKATGYCQQAVTKLPEKLKSMLALTQVGGVILFSENLQNTQQILALNKSLQTAVMSSQSIPLYIGIDQEGGRVSRLPQHEYLGFAGNMAIGATLFDNHTALINQERSSNTHYAEQTAIAMANQLSYLGFNVNFAPVLDVNNNPNNPIINVRSYGQSAKQVAKAGAAAIQAMQSIGIATAAKHFPGHGDTHIDSHVGLPVVSHNLDEIYTVDIAPFAQAIANPDTQPDMIMTAHIQYPALDNTAFVSKNGESTILPATLSAKILTGLLREKLAYKGLIVTDSLEMAAITQFLSPQQAVIKAFKAGADITLMPFKISSAQDADAFNLWLDELTQAISKDKRLLKKIKASYQAIVLHKQALGLSEKVKLFLQDTYPSSAYKSDNDRLLATQLSRASFTQIKPALLYLPAKNAQKSTHALINDPNATIVAIMPDKLRCRALIDSAHKAGVANLACISALSQSIPIELAQVDLFIVGDVTPALGFYESKATEGITAQQRQTPETQLIAVNKLIRNLPPMTKKVLIKLRAPYVNVQEVNSFDAIYASYDYQVVVYPDGRILSPAFDTLVMTLLGKYQAQGQLPVTLNEKVSELLY